MNIQTARWRVYASILALGLLCLPSAAQGSREGNVDYAQVRPSVQNFEQALNGAVNGTFGAFSMLGKPKGAFVPGYGYMFSFLVNIRWSTINSPMGTFSSGVASTPEQRKKQIDDMKDQVLQLLISQGAAMPKLARDKCITVIAFLEETNLERTVNKTILMSVLKSDLDELGNRQERYNEIKQRVKIVEY